MHFVGATRSEERQVNNMAYGYQRPDPKNQFRSWLRYQSELLVIAAQEGYTEEQAIEMLKAYYLAGIQTNTGCIGGNY